MNKKAFTLVELLAVIVILSLIILIAAVSITKITKDAKNTLSNTQIKLIKSAAESWTAKNPDKIPSVSSCIYITIEDLKNENFLSQSVVDINSNSEIEDTMKVKIYVTLSDYGNKVINYEVNSNNVVGCSHAY